MPLWIEIALVVIGVLVVLKMVFAFSLLSVFPVTRGAMFHPSARIRVKAFLDNVPMRPEDTFFDLGCGDGRVLKEAHKRYGVKAVGYEVNPLAYLLARIRTAGTEDVEVRLRDFWKVNLRDADVVFCYLFPDVMRELGRKFAGELRPGARIISCNFPIPGWKHENVLIPNSSVHNDPIYIYRVMESCIFVSQEEENMHDVAQEWEKP